MGLTLILLLAIYPLLDTLLGFNDQTDPLQEGRGHNFIVHLHGFFVPILLLTMF